MNIYNIQNFKDKKDDILSLLSQLTSCPEIPQEIFNNVVDNLNDKHKIFVYVEQNKIIGMISMFIEQKLIHGASCVAHIEDLVVHKGYRGRGIANDLMTHCLDDISKYNVYKVILNCDIRLEQFYKKFGFECKNMQMALYHRRDSNPRPSG